MRNLRKPLLVLALGGTLAMPAFAQQPAPPAYPAACDASKVSQADRDRAHKVFQACRDFLDERNFDKAIGYFVDAYTIDCSVHGILGVIATAYELKGDRRAAVRALEEYVKRAPNDPDIEKIQKRLATLRDEIAHEQGTTTAPGSSSAPTATTTGTPTASGTATGTGAVTASAGPTESSSGGAPPPQGGHSVGPWIIVGVGAAAVIGGVILFVVGNNTVNNANADAQKKGCSLNPDKCPNQTIADQVTNERNPGYTNETIGAVIGGVGVAAIAGGLVWHFLERPAAPEQPAGGARLSPVVSPGYAGVALHGSF